jgi:hypothetical protein
MMHHQELVSIPCDKDAPSFTPQEESKPVAYSHVINFPRTNPCGGLGDCGPSCVMCGRIDGRDCTIPNQNKNVCNSCDSLRWYNTSQQLEFKFCKGTQPIHILVILPATLSLKLSNAYQAARTSYASSTSPRNLLLPSVPSAGCGPGRLTSRGGPRRAWPPVDPLREARSRCSMDRLRLKDRREN